jgi:HD-GYP domain-containing protein (c-di-GMP phosphodiesterase class II)
MIIGIDVKEDNQVILPKGVVLTEDKIQQLSSLLGSNKRVWIYDLAELKPLLLRDSNLARSYINFLVSQLEQIFNTDLYDTFAFNDLVNTLNRYLFTNRNLLYELIVLRNNHCYTYEHSMNVALYSLIIGLNEELTTHELQILVLGCALHDLGKRNISNTILDKPSKLTATEFKAIQQHPLYGVELSHNLSCVDNRVEKIILQHHEKLDGSGYPYGLGYNKINHLSRIAAVADMFDAISSKRVYHNNRSIPDSVDILDGDVARGKIAKDEVDNLVKGLVMYPINTMVLLNNNQTGFVIANCNSRTPMILGNNNVTYDLSVDKGLAIEKVL